MSLFNQGGLKAIPIFIYLTKRNYEIAFIGKLKGHLLQLTPFFLYLLQHFPLGFIQLALQTVSQAFDINETTGVVFLVSV